MIIIPIKEEFDRMLLTVSALIDQLEQRRYTFIDESRNFAGSVEKLGEKYQLPFSVEAGIIRGRLCVVDEMTGFRQEHRQGNGYGGESRRTYRRNREAYALKQLDELCRQVRSYFAQADAVFQESLNLCRQLAAVAQTKAILPQLEKEGRDKQIRQLFEKFRQDTDLAGICTHVLGLAGLPNAVILFDRALGEIGE